MKQKMIEEKEAGNKIIFLIYVSNGLVVIQLSFRE